MPNRWLCLAIVAFWLATTGWLFWTEVLPDLAPGQPPPYAIDLLDEVDYGKADVQWSVAIDGVETHLARSGVARLKDPPEWYHGKLPEEAFVVSFHMYQRRFGPAPSARATLQTLDSKHLLTRKGDLLATHTELTVGFAGAAVTAVLEGEVRDGRFLSRCRIPGLLEKDLAPVPVSRQGTFLNPLQPVTRIKGLRPGQEWDLPLVDPVADALAASAPFGVPERDTRLHARVLPQTQTLRWKDVDRPCLVIEYQGKRSEARTWVQEGSGLVLRQETALRDEAGRGRDGGDRRETLVLVRESLIED
jgi:hypothetical protein